MNKFTPEQEAEMLAKHQAVKAESDRLYNLSLTMSLEEAEAWKISAIATHKAASADRKINRTDETYAALMAAQKESSDAIEVYTRIRDGV
jgi:hypothetical protein